MIQRLCVCGRFFWPAIVNCQSPVYMPHQEHCDLRFLSSEQRETLLPSDQKKQTPIVLYFSDTQDYTRFVLAYLLAETP